MEFSQKQVRRAIRDFENAISALQVSGFKLYNTRVKELISLVEENNVLEFIIGPYLEMNVDFKEIENSEGEWFDINLPADKDMQIAYVFQIMQRASKGEFTIEDYAFNIFLQTQINLNLIEWNRQILNPVLEILINKLDDLVEDEVEGKEQIDTSALQIINFGSITAQNGNVAIGNDIKQGIYMGRLSTEIIQKALAGKIITEGQVLELKAITEQIEEQLGSNSPSKNILIEAANKLYKLGSKGLLSLTTNVITNPKWGEAVTAFLIGLI